MHIQHHWVRGKYYLWLYPDVFLTWCRVWHSSKFWHNIFWPIFWSIQIYSSHSLPGAWEWQIITSDWCLIHCRSANSSVQVQYLRIERSNLSNDITDISWNMSNDLGAVHILRQPKLGACRPPVPPHQHLNDPPPPLVSFCQHLPDGPFVQQFLT